MHTNLRADRRYVIDVLHRTRTTHLAQALSMGVMPIDGT
jgi:hypothetical protein